MTEDELKIVRRAYAKQVMAAARAYAKQVMAAVQVAERIENCFAAVRREDFLGPGPWPIFRFRQSYIPTPTDDPIYLYTDDIVGIAPERHINNGQPSLHAHLLARAAPQPGDHVVHVGAGVGYYSAIMAHLVGPSGRVTAIEFAPDLAARAKSNLTAYANVSVVEGDGSKVPFDPADVIYVNAGATRPADSWLDRLKDAGRLILPLTTDQGFNRDLRNIMHRGAVFLITRKAEEFRARWISPVAIYPCEGMRDAESERALAAAFDKKGEWIRVTRLYRTDDLAEERCWLRAPGWCLAYE
jgi:protein-L-isoaspartate(D-aspartate) O-methyltransferase